MANAPEFYTGDSYHRSRADGQNPRRKADGMPMPPSFTRGMLTIALEQMVRTLGIKPTACQCPRVLLGGFLPAL